MTDLIQSQLKVIAVMVYCGLTAGLIIDAVSYTHLTLPTTPYV